MTLGAPLPTLSQVQSLDTAYLREAAASWSQTAQLWEQVFTGIRGRVSAPGGTPWQGEGAEAAQLASHQDLVLVGGAADQLHQAGAIARRGDGQLQACKEGLLEAVDEARADGFDVGEQYSVTDRMRGGSPEFQAARSAAAQGHASFIRHRLAALLASDQQLTTQLAAVTLGVDDLTFPDAPGSDDAVVGDGDKHDGIQLVDLHSWKQDPQPIPPDPEPGPLPPVNNADDVRRVLDPLQNGGKRGPNGVGTRPDIKELWDAATIKRMWDYLTRNATDSPGRPGYKGPVRVLPDGTRIGLRQSSDGWGDTLDVWYPNGDDIKIHTPYLPPLISPPPQLPPPGHPAPLPLPPTQLVDPRTLPPWLQNPSPPGFVVTPGAPLPFAPFDVPGAPAIPAPTAPSPGGSPSWPNLAHDLAEAGKTAGAGVLAGIAVIGGIMSGGLTPGGQLAR